MWSFSHSKLMRGKKLRPPICRLGTALCVSDNKVGLFFKGIWRIADADELFSRNMGDGRILSAVILDKDYSLYYHSLVSASKLKKLTSNSEQQQRDERASLDGKKKVEMVKRLHENVRQFQKKNDQYASHANKGRRRVIFEPGEDLRMNPLEEKGDDENQRLEQAHSSTLRDHLQILVDLLQEQ
ncbi:hypothetical protein D0Y65_004060 [Glycine soja]|uniref:Uncharacterized protein n=1 Tax=Glycine soja TaxID=3848 RepID=A0A445LPN7_GLYSO|nr:hypothetical protein D0Y65_004060 [Glycine soja]